MSNTLTITGNLGGDPELRFTPNGDAVCNVSIADTPRRQNLAGEWEDAGETLWIRVSVWREAGEALADVAKRGDKVTATGRLTVRLFERQDGTQGQSLELQHATVAVVPRSAARSESVPQSRPTQERAQSRPGSPDAPSRRPQPQQQSWSPQDSYDEPPF